MPEPSKNVNKMISRQPRRPSALCEDCFHQSLSYDSRSGLYHAICFHNGIRAVWESLDYLGEDWFLLMLIRSDQIESKM